MPAKPRTRKSNSDTRDKLIEATRAVMIEDGYGAVTSRRVAARAGVKPQLIYYHFSTMEDLFIAVLRHIFDEILANYTRCLTSGKPLKSLWEHSFKQESAILTVEFMALANHREAIGRELVRFGSQIRGMQEELFSMIMQRHGIDQSEIPPISLSVLLLSLSHTMGVEATWGLTKGHAETVGLVQRLIQQFELTQDTESK